MLLAKAVHVMMMMGPMLMSWVGVLGGFCCVSHVGVFIDGSKDSYNGLGVVVSDGLHFCFGSSQGLGNDCSVGVK